MTDCAVLEKKLGCRKRSGVEVTLIHDADQLRVMAINLGLLDG